MLKSPFNRVTGLKDWNFVKKRFQHKRFPVNIAKFLRTVLLTVANFLVYNKYLMNLYKKKR